MTAPPNVFIDNLASSGIVGSLAFVFMVCVTVRTMFRLPYALGTLGLVILVFHYVDGLFDIFWIGASSIAPFIIAGISLGLADMDKVARRAGESGTADARAAPATPGPAGRRSSRPRRPPVCPPPMRARMSAATTGLAAGSSAVTARLPAAARRRPPAWRRYSRPVDRHADSTVTGHSPRIAYNALPLDPRGGGVSTYIRELLAAMVAEVDADLVAAVRPGGASELPDRIHPLIKGDSGGSGGR